MNSPRHSGQGGFWGQRRAPRIFPPASPRGQVIASRRDPLQAGGRAMAFREKARAPISQERDNPVFIARPALQKESRLAIHELGQQDRADQAQPDEGEERAPRTHPQPGQQPHQESDGVVQEDRHQEGLQHRPQVGERRAKGENRQHNLRDLGGPPGIGNATQRSSASRGRRRRHPGKPFRKTRRTHLPDRAEQHRSWPPPTPPHAATGDVRTALPPATELSPADRPGRSHPPCVPNWRGDPAGDGPVPGHTTRPPFHLPISPSARQANRQPLE